VKNVEEIKGLAHDPLQKQAQGNTKKKRISLKEKR